MAPPFKGSCQCGRITYEIDAEPIVAIACHCMDCQKASNTAYSVTAVFPEKAFAVRGDLQRFESLADSGRRKVGYFCPQCGNRIYNVDPDSPETIRLKPGTLDSGPMPEPQAHVWVSRKQPWLELPQAAITFPENAVDLGKALRAKKNR